MEKKQSQTTAQESSTVPAKQPDPERERKRAWLNRYRESLAEQRRIAERLAEVRSCSTSICVSLNPAKAAGRTTARAEHRHRDNQRSVRPTTVDPESDSGAVLSVYRRADCSQNSR